MWRIVSDVKPEENEVCWLLQPTGIINKVKYINDEFREYNCYHLPVYNTVGCYWCNYEQIQDVDQVYLAKRCKRSYKRENSANIQVI